MPKSWQLCQLTKLLKAADHLIHANVFTRGFEAKLARGKLFFHSEFNVEIWFRETLLPPGPRHRDCHIVWPCMSEFKVIIPNKRTPRPCQFKLQIPTNYQLIANNPLIIDRN